MKMLTTTRTMMPKTMDDRMMDDDLFLQPFDKVSWLTDPASTLSRNSIDTLKPPLSRDGKCLAFHVGSCLHPPFERRNVFRWSNHVFINHSVQQGYGNANHSHFKSIYTHLHFEKAQQLFAMLYMRVYQACHDERALFD